MLMSPRRPHPPAVALRSLPHSSKGVMRSGSAPLSGSDSDDLRRTVSKLEEVVELVGREREGMLERLSALEKVSSAATSAGGSAVEDGSLSVQVAAIATGLETILCEVASLRERSMDDHHATRTASNTEIVERWGGCIASRRARHSDSASRAGIESISGIICSCAARTIETPHNYRWRDTGASIS
jgi:hypothetical protein